MESGALKPVNQLEAEGIENELMLFGVDISVFTGLQQSYLLNWRYSDKQSEALRRTGVSPATLQNWRKKYPVFEEALGKIREGSKRAAMVVAESPGMATARDHVRQIMADGAVMAAQEMIKMVNTKWGDLSDRGKATKLKAIEDVLKSVGAEAPNPGTGKIDMLALVSALAGDNGGRAPKVAVIAVQSRNLLENTGELETESVEEADNPPYDTKAVI